MDNENERKKREEKPQIHSFNEFDDDFDETADSIDGNEYDEDNGNIEEPEEEEITEDDNSIVENIHPMDAEHNAGVARGAGLESEGRQEENPTDVISRLQERQLNEPIPSPKPKRTRRENKAENTVYKEHFVKTVRGNEEDKYFELSKYSSILSKVKIRKKDWATNKFVFVEHGMIDYDLTGDLEEKLQGLMDFAVRKWGKGEYMFTFSTPSMVGKDAKKISIQAQIGETPESKPDVEVKKETPVENDVLKTISAMQENTNKTIMTLMDRMEQQKKEEAQKLQEQVRRSEERFMKLLEANKKSVSSTETSAMTAIVQLMNAQLQQSQQSNKETMNMFMKSLQNNNNKSDSLQEAMEVVRTMKDLNPPVKTNPTGGLLETLQVLRELDNFRSGQPLSYEEGEDEGDEEPEKEPENPWKSILGLVGTRIGEGVGKAVVGQAPIPTQEIQQSVKQQVAPPTTQGQEIVDAEVVDEDVQTSKNYLADIISAIIQAKEAGVPNQEIAKSYKELYKKVESQYGSFIKSNTPQAIVEMGTKIDSRLNGKYHQDFIDIFTKLMA